MIDAKHSDGDPAAPALAGHAGGRLTQLRRQVFDILVGAAGPVTAYELLDRLRAARPATAAGVYRSLDFLVARGLAHRLESRKAFVACAHPDRPHVSQFLICRRCGAVVEIDDARVAVVVDEWRRKFDFVVEAETLEVSGLCAVCRGGEAVDGTI